MKKRASLGLKDGQVCLVAYDRRWSKLFSNEEKVLRGLFEKSLVDIQHIGSTALPGISAKPVIDIAVALKSFARFDSIIRKIEAMGYESKGEFGLTGRQFFTKGDPTMFHVHVVEWPSPHWDRWIRFRDRLRKSKKLRDEYEALKKMLSKKYRRNRKAYTAAKDPFVERVISDEKE